MAGSVGRPLRLTLLWGLPLFFLGYFFVYPLIRILAESWDGITLTEVLTRPRFRRAAWFTIWQATVSTALTLGAALPLTWALSRVELSGKNLIRALVTVPFVLPTVVVGASFLNLMPRGITAILAAHVFFNVAVVVRTVGGVWSRIDPRVEEAATTLGASPLQVLRTVTLPLLRPALASAAAIVFLFCFTSFGTVLILGGGNLRTLEVEIYQQAINFFDLPVAAGLAIVQFAFVLLALLVADRMQARIGIDLSSEVPPSLHRRRKVLARWIVGVTIGLLAVPLLSLVWGSIARQGWRGLAGQSQVAVNPVEAIGNSLLYALIATVIATAVGLAAAQLIIGQRGRWLDTVLMLPLGVSAVTVGLGFLIALDRPIDLRGSFLLVPLAHALVATPFVVRSTVPLLRAIKPEIREAARVLGASPSRVWNEIDFPIIRRAVLVGAGFAAAVSLGEFGATAFVARPASTTIPALIFRLLGRAGTASYGTALALAVVLAAITTTVILLIDRFRGADEGWL